MGKIALVLFAGAALATVAFGQENNAPPAEQKQAQTDQANSNENKCCGKDCCKHMAKKDKALKKDKSKESGMGCCK